MANEEIKLLKVIDYIDRFEVLAILDEQINFCAEPPVDKAVLELLCELKVRIKDILSVDFAKVTGYQAYGSIRFVPEDAFEDELDIVKSAVLSEIIGVMQREAEENPDFFIVKREMAGDPLTRNSVGLKVYLPKRRSE